MAKQTFIIRLEDKDGKMVDFERWAYKKAETCISKMIKLYSEHSIYEYNLAKADKVVAYPTPNGYDMEEPVWSVSVEEFRELMKKAKEVA